MKYADLIQFATVRQLEFIEAIEKHGSIRSAAKALGISRTTIGVAIERLQRRASLKVYAPPQPSASGAVTVPESQIIRGVSQFYDATGQPGMRWVKTRIDEEKREETIREYVAALAEDIRGLAPLTEPPMRADADLLAVYPSGDPHWGLRTWAAECGENFDLDIARRLTRGAVDRLVASAPAAHTAIFLPLGDTLHANDQTSQTPRSKHPLDVDGRFVKVLGVCIQAYRHAIIRLLERHQNVVVRFVSGNHDPEAVWTLAFTIAAYFASEPRVTVDLSPAAHWYYRFGKVLIGATHGDKSKPEQLPGLMATDRAEDWGQTRFRYWYTGHIHHQTVKEYPGVTCESFRTLAAGDSHSAAYAYRSGRDMRLIVHHRDFGEIERHRCDVAMLEPA